jgi:hypothetical protein
VLTSGVLSAGVTTLTKSRNTWWEQRQDHSVCQPTR